MSKNTFLSAESAYDSIVVLKNPQLRLQGTRKNVIYVDCESNPSLTQLRVRNKLAALAAMRKFEYTEFTPNGNRKVSLSYSDFFKKVQRTVVADAVSRNGNPVTLLYDQYAKAGLNLLDTPLNYLELSADHFRRMSQYYQPWNLSPAEEIELAVCLALLLNNLPIPAKELVCSDFVSRLV